MKHSVISFMWINEEYDPDAQFIFTKYRVKPFKVYQQRIFDWAEQNPESDIIFWYDSSTTSSIAVNNTKAAFAENTRIQVLDIHSLGYIRENRHILDVLPQYAKIDTLKLMLSYCGLASYNTSCFFDLSCDVKPLTEINKDLAAAGMIHGHNENRALIFANQREVKTALRTVTNSVLYRCKTILNFGTKLPFLKAHIRNLYNNIYEMTVGMLPAVISLLKYGKIHLSRNLDRLSQIIDQPQIVDCDFLDQNHNSYKIFGNYYCIRIHRVMHVLFQTDYNYNNYNVTDYYDLGFTFFRKKNGEFMSISRGTEFRDLQSIFEKQHDYSASVEFWSGMNTHEENVTKTLHAVRSCIVYRPHYLANDPTQQIVIDTNPVYDAVYIDNHKDASKKIATSVSDTTQRIIEEYQAVKPEIKRNFDEANKKINSLIVISFLGSEETVKFGKKIEKIKSTTQESIKQPKKFNFVYEVAKELWGMFRHGVMNIGVSKSKSFAAQERQRQKQQTKRDISAQ